MTDTSLQVYEGAFARYAQRQARLIDVLACPTCSGPLGMEHAVYDDQAVVAADLVCSVHGRVGLIDDYRPSFLDRELSRIPSGPRTVVSVRRHAAGTDFRGAWFESAHGSASDAPGSSAVVPIEGHGVLLYLFAHPLGGVAEIRLDGSVIEEVDLHSVDADLLEVPVEWAGDERHEVAVVVSGRRADGSEGGQVVVNRAEELVPVGRGVRPDLTPANRGNGYPPGFEELLFDLPREALALDCGGGDRRHLDTRVYNLEYLWFDLPDLYGDGLCLPVSDDTFDLVLSQAVIEHVADPQRAVDEITRIIKPGGILYMEIAFMQPLHAVPSHYFNVTPYGLQHLTRGLEVEELSWFGGLADTVAWLGGCVNASAKIGDARFASVVAALRDVDAAIGHEELKAVASGVSVVARKPLR